MFNWNDEQQQAGDAIWAEFNDSGDHIVPYPKGVEDSTIVSARDLKNNEEEVASIAGISEHSTGVQTGLQVMEKQTANQTCAHFSATQIDMESWPDLPSLNPTLDRNYSDDNIASTYLAFSAEPSLQKVTGNATGQIDGESEVFGNDQEEKSNSFLDCDWGNIGDFDDFDRLFSNSDSIFGNGIVASDNDFLSASSNLMDNAVQSIPIPQLPLNKRPSSDRGPSLVLTKEISSGVTITKQENKVEVHKRPARSRRKPEERGKSKISSSASGFSPSKLENSSSNLQAPMQHVQTPQYALFQDSKKIGKVQHANQFMFPEYGYPAYPFPTIPLVSNIQADGYQTKSAGTSCRTSEDSPKQSSSIEMSQDIPSRPLSMTPQEKIEKLRRRQQMQALIAIQRQQQQFGQQGSGSDPMVSQAYSLRNKNLDSLGSSIVIDENTNEIFSPEMIPTYHGPVHKSSAISDDPFIEEKIYYQLQDALDKLDTKTRLCIRDSLLRLAHSATERQIDGDRSSTNKTNKDEDEASEDAFTRRTRSPTKEEETITNPTDRIVAYLLFHRHCSQVAAATKEEIISSTPLTLEPELKVPLGTTMVLSEDQLLSEDQRDEQKNVLQPSQ
ncbi:protein LNK2 isoform X2 [Zea mays]|uniref:Protein LNK2 n=2 Tax=Zea mays TaxID=4577 RepID=A0A804N3Q1_MAIZE|nr:protein LNK2 isoform X2 [Zea mays]XP_020405829.1 protein LNK2 isoform X2 [Zea mays]|eukprot:XP_020405828.1 protein LNK2 isoform X2 [Zea mays]